MAEMRKDFLMARLNNRQRDEIMEHGHSGNVKTSLIKTRHCNESWCEDFILIIYVLCNDCGAFLFTIGNKGRACMHYVVETGHG